MAAIKEDYFLQSDPDAVAQYAESFRKALSFGGEKMLMLAVLEEAVDCYKRNLLAKDHKAQNLFVESEAWLSVHGDDVLFSLENVCDALDWTPTTCVPVCGAGKKTSLRSVRCATPVTNPNNKVRRRKRVA